MSQLELGLTFGPMGEVDIEVFAQGFDYIVGVDEAGRGPLAGPVSTAGVAVSRADWAELAGVNDSKQMRANARQHWEARIKSLVRWHQVDLQPIEIDKLNILGASLEGMRRCAEALIRELQGAKVMVLVDGNHGLRGFDGMQLPLVKGDARSRVVAAASVLAKEHRDRELDLLDAQYPGYGLARHKGYPTRDHLAALHALGPTPIHRMSYAPVSAAAATFASRGR